MLSLLDNLSSLDCLYIYIRCKGHKRWKLANRMSGGTMLTWKFNPSIRRRFDSFDHIDATRESCTISGRAEWQTCILRFAIELEISCQRQQNLERRSRQFEESRENQDSKSVTRTGNDQSCCEFAFSRETDLSRDLYPRQCLLNLRIFTGGTL